MYFNEKENNLTLYNYDMKRLEKKLGENFFTALPEMLEACKAFVQRGIPAFLDSQSVANFMYGSRKYLRGIRYLHECSNNTCKHYKHIVIKKRNGEPRDIYAPDHLLKSYQTELLESIFDKLEVSEYAYAYKKGTSIKDNAGMHVCADKLLKLDITDFFGSIKYIQVFNVIMKNTGYSRDVVTLLSNLCCYEGHLPQGAPTSPVLSNLIFTPIDEIIARFCKKRNINYSRYADDMSFSGSFDVFPLMSFVSRILKQNGFLLNAQKTKVLGRGTSQRITGIITNEKLQVDKAYRKKIRQEMYFINKFGIRGHLLKTADQRYIKHNTVYKKRYLHSLLGRINYVLFINEEDKEFTGYREKVINLQLNAEDKQFQMLC